METLRQAVDLLPPWGYLRLLMEETVYGVRMSRD